MSQPQNASQADQSNTGKPAVFDEQTPIRTLANMTRALERWRPQLISLSPHGEAFKAKRFEAILLACASRTPKLLHCTYFSLRQAVQHSAELGLDLGSVNGEAYLIPYDNRKKITHENGREEWITVTEATFMAGYKGYIRLAHESGLFRAFYALPIYEHEEFDPPRRGPTGVLWEHREDPFSVPASMQLETERSQWTNGSRTTEKVTVSVPKLKGAYAVAQLKGSHTDDVIRVVPAWRLEEIRNRSKAGQDGPWITDYAEMAAKTAVRAIWKQLPKTEQMERLEAADQELDLAPVTHGERPVTVQVPAEVKPSAAARKTATVADRINANASAPQNKEVPPAPQTPTPPTSRSGGNGGGPDRNEGAPTTAGES